MNLFKMKNKKRKNNLQLNNKVSHLYLVAKINYLCDKIQIYVVKIILYVFQLFKLIDV